MIDMLDPTVLQSPDYNAVSIRLASPKDLLAKQAVAFGLVVAVVDRLRALYFALRPRTESRNKVNILSAGNPLVEL